MCGSRNRLMKPTISNLPLNAVLGSYSVLWKNNYIIFNRILNFILGPWIYIYILNFYLRCFIYFNNFGSFFKHPNMSIESFLGFLFVDLKLSVTLWFSIIINPIYITRMITTVSKNYLHWLGPFS